MNPAAAIENRYASAGTGRVNEPSAPDVVVATRCPVREDATISAPAIGAPDGSRTLPVMVWDAAEGLWAKTRAGSRQKAAANSTERHVRGKIQLLAPAYAAP